MGNTPPPVAPKCPECGSANSTKVREVRGLPEYRCSGCGDVWRDLDSHAPVPVASAIRAKPEGECPNCREPFIRVHRFIKPEGEVMYVHKDGLHVNALGPRQEEDGCIVKEGGGAERPPADLPEEDLRALQTLLSQGVLTDDEVSRLENLGRALSVGNGIEPHHLETAGRGLVVLAEKLRTYRGLFADTREQLVSLEDENIRLMRLARRRKKTAEGRKKRGTRSR